MYCNAFPPRSRTPVESVRIVPLWLSCPIGSPHRLVCPERDPRYMVFSLTTWRRGRRSLGLWQVRLRWNSGGHKGRWPASFDRFWETLQQRRGKQGGTRAMIEVLLAKTDLFFAIHLLSPNE